MSDLGFRITAAGPIPAHCDAAAKPVATQPIYDNTLTALAAAELTRRLVLHSSVAPALRFPFLTQVCAKPERGL